MTCHCEFKQYASVETKKNRGTIFEKSWNLFNFDTNSFSSLPRQDIESCGFGTPKLLNEFHLNWKCMVININIEWEYVCPIHISYHIPCSWNIVKFGWRLLNNLLRSPVIYSFVQYILLIFLLFTKKRKLKTNIRLCRPHSQSSSNFVKITLCSCISICCVSRVFFTPWLNMAFAGWLEGLRVLGSGVTASGCLRACYKVSMKWAKSSASNAAHKICSVK